MKILMLLENEFPPDNRVEKEAVVLIRSGHEVHILCNTRKSLAPSESINGIRVFRMPLSGFCYKLSALVLVLPFYLRRWRKNAEYLHGLHHYDVVHVHDLPLSATGLYLKSKYGIKLVCDQHEYYSDWIVETAHYNTPVGRVVKALSNWKRYERRALENADRVITVEDPLRQQYLKEYRIGSDRLFTLPNTPSTEVFHPGNADPGLFSQYVKPFTLLYFGGIDILRGIDNVIHAIPHIIKTIPDFKFILAGVVYKGYDPVRSAQRLGVEEYVDFIGWIDLEKLPSLIAVADLGIFTPPSFRLEINKTIATKIYQFLAMHTPVIVGRAKYMKEFVESTRTGISVDETSPEEISDAVINIATDARLKNELTTHCKAISEQYTWEKTSEILIHHYAELWKEC